MVLRDEPFQTYIDFKYQTLKIKLSFQGHYAEPDYTLEVSLEELNKNGFMQSYLMLYNPFEGVWEFCVAI